jgi:hypothetical protein
MNTKILMSTTARCAIVFGGVLITTSLLQGQTTVGNTSVIDFLPVGVFNNGGGVVLGTATINTDALPQIFWVNLNIGTVDTPPNSLTMTLPEAGPSASFTFDYIDGYTYSVVASDLLSLASLIRRADNNSLDTRVFGPPGTFSIESIGSPELVLGHTAAVPEPAAFVVIAGGVAFGAVLSRRKARL